MARSHPPTLLTVLARTLRQECQLRRGDRIVVAVSGGGDSQSLLHGLATVAPRRGLSLVAHGVDHGLRAEASAELDLAAELAARLGVAFARTEISVPAGPNLMHRARRARYAALRAAARQHGAAFIATAHHADDRAETVLLRLLRGAGPRGLGVLAPRAGDLLRPLIRVRRREVHAHLARHRLAFARDPSNEDRRFLRVRVRHELMPVLESLSPEVVSHLNALADQLAAEPLPAIVDAEGSIVELGRAHADALRELLRTGSREGRVRLPGDREIRLDPRGNAVVETAPGLRPSSRGAKPRKND